MIDQRLIDAAERKWIREWIASEDLGAILMDIDAFRDGIKEGIRLANEAAQPIISNLEMMLSGAKEEEPE
jgi:hypothetical protein